jgi:hypothetical protein
VWLQIPGVVINQQVVEVGMPGCPLRKKAEYLEKQRMAWRQKSDATVSENSTKPQSSGQGYCACLIDENKVESGPSSRRVSPGKMKMDSVYHSYEGTCGIINRFSRQCRYVADGARTFLYYRSSVNTSCTRYKSHPTNFYASLLNLKYSFHTMTISKT